MPFPFPPHRKAPVFPPGALHLTPRPKIHLHLGRPAYPGNPTPGTHPPRPVSAPDFNLGWQWSVYTSTALGKRDSSVNTQPISGSKWSYPPGTLLSLTSVFHYLDTWAASMALSLDALPWYQTYYPLTSPNMWMRWDGTLVTLPGGA